MVFDVFQSVGALASSKHCVNLLAGRRGEDVSVALIYSAMSLPQHRTALSHRIDNLAKLGVVKWRTGWNGVGISLNSAKRLVGRALHSIVTEFLSRLSSKELAVVGYILAVNSTLALDFTSTNSLIPPSNAVVVN